MEAKVRANRFEWTHAPRYVLCYIHDLELPSHILAFSKVHLSLAPASLVSLHVDNRSSVDMSSLEKVVENGEHESPAEHDAGPVHV